MTTPTTDTLTGARSQRVARLLEELSLEEKLAQLVGLWMGIDAEGSGDIVAPLQDAMQGKVTTFEQFAEHGLGQFTRPFGTVPVDPAGASEQLAAKQDWLRANTKHGIPALVHEECLTGLAAWQATTFPAPLAWGAGFDPELIEEMGAAIGESMRGLGIHQGLAPVLDVVRDARWGRVEECIAEDPYVVATIATAYVRGVQSTGLVATLKHFVGYSNSRAGRNLAPVHAGPREVEDVLLFPFEMAVLDGGVRSVMNSYAEIDGIPVAADEALLTGVLRDRWGFEGTVVADYFAVAFLQTLHGLAGDLGSAAGLALAAGIDVELPTGAAYLEPLADAVRSGAVPMELVDRALTRVLIQKAELGLLDDDYDPRAGRNTELDPPAHRALAKRIAEQSVILLENDGTLPLAAGKRIAVIGPNADDRAALFGCYSFANHVLPQHPATPLGFEAPTILEALREEFGGASGELAFAKGCEVDTDDESGFDEAVQLAASSEIAVVVVGDRSGLFGRGTSGEGCDVSSLELPGVQRRLVERIAETGTPVVLVLVTGRPYNLDWAAGTVNAVVQTFFPGEEGASAIAGVASGRINPSGRLPVSVSRSAGLQPFSYLHPKLGGASSVSNIDTAPVYAFGHGRSYTDFSYSGFAVAAEARTDGAITASVVVRNAGELAGDEIVQLYGVDPVASVTRPVSQLLGYARVRTSPGESVRVEFDVPSRLLAFSDRSMEKIVEPGEIRVSVRTSATQVVEETSIQLVGGVHRVSVDDRRTTNVIVTSLGTDGGAAPGETPVGNGNSDSDSEQGGTR